MNPQNNFFQKILPFLLIAVLIVVAFFIFKKNPEIMSPESYFKILQKKGELSATLIVYPQTQENIFSPKTLNEIGSSSHRYSEMKPEQFSEIPIKSYPFEWAILRQSAPAKQNIIVIEKNKLTVTTKEGALIRSFLLPSTTDFSPGPPCLYGDVLYLTTLNGRIYAVDTQTGQLIWYYQSTLQFSHSPMMSQDHLVLFFSEKDNPTWRYQILDGKTGQLIFRNENVEQPFVGHPLIKNKTLYFATRSGRLKSVQLDTGKTIWTADNSANFTGQLTMTNDRLFISDESGLLLGYETTEGQRINEIPLQGSLIHTTLRVEDSSLIVAGTSDNSIIGIDLKSGKAIWQHPLDLQKGRSAHLKLVKLNTQSLNQLSFNSKVRGWTAWAFCRTANICIFDVKSGLLLSRLDLKGTPVARFELLPAGTEDLPARLFVPLLREGRTLIAGFSSPTTALLNSKPSPLTK